MRFIKQLLIAAFAVSTVSMGYGLETRSAAKPNSLLIADPTIMLDGDYYYLYGTSLSNGFQTYRSTDMENWEGPLGNITGNYVLKKGESCHVENRFWAPQVFKHNGKYHMFYAGDNYLVHATADSPLGPFRENTMKAIPANEQEIDPFVFFDHDGTPYIYWSNRVSGTQSILGAQMTDDLENIKRDTQQVLFKWYTTGWEVANPANHRIVEGPAVIEHDGTYYMLYSANGCDDVEYAVGVATATSPLGPWTKPKSPIISAETVKENGPGHGDIFYDKEGRLMYVFHVHHDDTTVYPRRTVIMQLQFKDGQLVPVEDSFRFLTLTKAVVDPIDLSKCIQVRIKNDSGLVVGGTDTPTLVAADDNDDSQVFYISQTSYNNWSDGRPATYPGFYLIQKSSGKYLIENSFDAAANFGTLAYSDSFTDSNGNWVPNDNAKDAGIPFQICLNQVGNRLCATAGDKIGTSGTPGATGSGFRFELCNYTGDVWLRGPGLTGSGQWNNCIKLEKDHTNPGIYYHNMLSINHLLALRLTLQNDDTTYTLNLSSIPEQETIVDTNRVVFNSETGNNFQFVPFQFYYNWRAPKTGNFNLNLNLNTMHVSLKEGDKTGIEEIEVAETDDASARYFNLQGVEIANPENGIYIRVSGNKADKVIIK